MKTIAVAAACAAIAYASALQAHHSGYMYSSIPVWFEGTVVGFEPINPHTLMTVEQQPADGTIVQWVIEGPPQTRLNRPGDVLSAPPVGARISVCGFPYKPVEELEALFPGADFSTRRLADNADGAGPVHVAGHVLLTDSGELQAWEPHGLISECMRSSDQPRERWLAFINSNRGVRDAWCEQQSYAHVRETAALTAFVEEVDRVIEAPCN
jgi:hypothetical protein